MSTRHFRPITYDELGAAADLNARAFRGDIERVRTMMEGNSRFSWRDTYAVEQDGELAAMLTAFSLDLWLGGAPIRTVAIAAVSVPPEHRRRGLARLMLRETHARFRNAGIPIALLYPFSVSFYRAVGYEIAEWRHYYRLPTSGLRLHAERSQVRLARQSDWPAVYAVYADYLRQRNGVQRTDAIWDERVHKREGEIAVYVSETGITGYVYYEFKRVQPGHGDDPGWSTVLVRELIALNGAAERGLLGFLAAQQEQAAAIHIVRAPDEPLGLAVAEPISYPDRRMEFIMHELYQGSAGILMRILDVPGAFAARRIPSHVSGVLSLTVADPEQPDAGPWRVTFGEGRATVETLTPHPPAPSPTRGEGKSGSPSPTSGEGVGGWGEIRVDIPTLSALYAGSLTATTAYRLGRLDGDDAAIELLDAALAVPPLVVQRADWF